MRTLVLLLVFPTPLLAGCSAFDAARTGRVQTDEDGAADQSALDQFFYGPPDMLEEQQAARAAIAEADRNTVMPASALVGLFRH